jgi:hypothetical protein
MDTPRTAVTHLRLTGRNHFELGVESARASGLGTRALLKTLSRWARTRPEYLGLLVKDAGSRSALLTRVYPERLSEARGFAAAAGIDLDDLMCARTMLESLAAPQCTNFGAVPPATADQDIMISWNFDSVYFLRLAMGRFPLYVREIDGTIPYVCLGRPGLLGIGVMNAEGLSCVVNAVGTTDGGEGLSPFDLNNQAMETCKTVREASAVFKEGPRQSLRTISLGMLMNWNMIWADLEGGLSVIECTHHHFHEQPAAGDGIIASANHHQFLDWDLGVSFNPSNEEWTIGSVSRLARMWALLREYRGSIDPVVARRIVSDHIPDYSVLKEYGIEREWWEPMVNAATICAHMWNIKRQVATGDLKHLVMESLPSCTLYSLQVQPKRMTVWFTLGHPCRNLARPIFWGKLLGAEPVMAMYPGTTEATNLPETRVTVKRDGIFNEGATLGQERLGRLWFELLDAFESPELKRQQRRQPAG